MMTDDEEPLRLSRGSPAPGPGLLGRIAGIAAGALLLIGAAMLSLVVLGVLVVLGLLGWGYLRWKTRHLRAQIDEHLRAAAGSPGSASPAGSGTASGRVIEGEAVREPDPNDPPHR
jgi:hypothetical protein